MAGKDEMTDGTAEGTADWLGPLFARLKRAVERAAEAVCTDEDLDADAAEKLARRVGVIARAAKLVEAIRPRIEADSEEDEMGGRSYDPEETERVRARLEANCERMDALLEIKQAEAVERRRLAAAGSGDAPASASTEPPG
ncbi:hypothetical protein [Brevundimonas sp. SORGH_AS_0993]|uniref:hypothetical protein n=1 Tax=Brevundimonas sp. SORGH_AS_0993 TaxID=3041794 RepID=UPI00277EC3FD|nr:hypothetical protein [Brevundimonas sp. SORGH_AS_0993]MDQ1155391.1 hypothetical protein [Brevundimonas sp. SORGH_AS_0993]